MATNIDELLVFLIVATLQRPGKVIWSKERNIVRLMKLIVSWKSNLEAAEDRKEKSYKGLIDAREEQGWVGVGARGYVARKGKMTSK